MCAAFSHIRRTSAQRVTMATLDAQRTHAVNLDIQILALERSLTALPLAALRARRTMVQDSLDSHKYPVLTLPNEIVSEIFIRFVPVYPERPSLDGIHSPINLTHICQKWRDIALSTPELWRAIQLFVGDYGDIPVSLQVQELDTWLSRSRSCPFSIEVLSFNSLEGSFIFSAARAVHWEHLKASLMISPSSTIEVPMPLLRHLDLILHSTDVDPRVHPLVFGEAPLLRSVVLNDFAALMVILPWVQLTSLTFRRAYPHKCDPVLKQTPNLVYCKLHLANHPPTTWPDVTLPCLESLSLVPASLMHPIAQTRYLETFIVPALCKLHIEETILENPIDTLTSFILKSGCRLREMYISGKRRVSREAYSQAFPSVKLSFDEDVGQVAGIASNTESDSESL
ncbi:hypothetical protein C8F04DRAFT_1069204 [Mycena alexandri]|uniref:F-box domain-containing protein n=1 Tax=Mycena alexandri TaxID=1745969 RepID=A0AAD6XA16_9AGAR|nr:hypothetical protein C8F04DRAFT_1069204 [Mycena alexandri]